MVGAVLVDHFGHPVSLGLAKGECQKPAPLAACNALPSKVIQKGRALCHRAVPQTGFRKSAGFRKSGSIDRQSGCLGHVGGVHIAKAAKQAAQVLWHRVQMIAQLIVLRAILQPCILGW